MENSKVVRICGKAHDISNMSKEDEGKFLDDLSRAFQTVGADSYMSSLFTRRFTEWCIGQMRNDFPVDVMEFGIDAVEKAERALSTQRIELSTELDSLRKRVAELEDYKEKSDAVRHNQKVELDQVIFERDDLRVELDQAGTIEIQMREVHRAQMAEKEAEIVALKAKLYDLMTAGK